MNLPKPTDDNNNIKVDIYDKKDKMNQIQLSFFGKNVKNQFLEETLVAVSTGQRNSWSQE